MRLLHQSHELTSSGNRWTGESNSFASQPRSSGTAGIAGENERASWNFTKSVFVRRSKKNVHQEHVMNASVWSVVLIPLLLAVVMGRL